MQDAPYREIPVKTPQGYLGIFTDENAAARAVNAFWSERGYEAPNDVPQAA